MIDNSATIAASAKSPSQRARLKLWLFRLAAVVCGLSLFAVAEGVCVWFGWGQPTEYDDPFVGFQGAQPLFVLDKAGERYEIPRSRQRFFHAESFNATKGPREFRVFVLGGSTVAGKPFAAETSFAKWLELALRAAEPERDFKVVNCGGISYASYRLTPILRECLDYRPDLFILSLGHNEFLEDRTYERQKYASPLLIAAQRAASRLRTSTLLQAGLTKLRRPGPAQVPQDRPLLPGEVDALLDHAGGLAAYHRDDAWQAGVVEHFGNCVREMIRSAGRAGVPIIIVHEPSNLVDCPPFKSEHRPGLSSEREADWRQLVEEARSHIRTQPGIAAEQFRQALAIDPDYALTWYELGQCCVALHEISEAREAFIRSRDLDICPLRMTTALEVQLDTAALETNTPLVNAHALLESRSKGGILGDFWLVDHVHPSIAGHQLLAETLLAEMAAGKLVVPEAGSDARRREMFAKHFDSLPPIYFERARRTLELLRGWAQGRAEDPPIARTGGPMPGDKSTGRVSE